MALDLDALELRMSARVERGVTTNRVRRARKPRRPPAKPIAEYAPNEKTKLVCVSIPPGELALIDAAAARLGMNRSSFLRAGAHALIAAHVAITKAER